MDEAELIRRARLGDTSAWEQLVPAYQQPVYRLAYLILGDADAAADVAQETFLRAMRSFGRFDPDRPLRPWLLTIAANLARNRRRAFARYIAALQRLFVAQAEPPADRLAPVARAQEAQELWQAVRRLGKEDQEVIYLRYFLELPVIETAQALDIAPGTVKSRLHRALGRLRQVVEQDFPALREGHEDGRTALP